MFGRVADAMIYSKKLPLLILAKIKHHLFGRYAVFEGDIHSLEREKLDSYRVTLSLLHRHILYVSEIVMSTGRIGGLRWR